LFPVTLWAILLLPVGYFALAIWDTGKQGPYVTRYNENRLELARKHHLIGKPESAIVPLLGKPTFIEREWDTTYMGTGKPTPEAKWYVTYSYAPYRFLPYAVFQVHLTSGTVTSLEMYED
jgi:hypothetical protein